jgi:hypothetical protein
VIAELGGVDMGFIEAWAAAGTVTRPGVALVAGDTVTPVDLPGQPILGELTLFAARDDLRAFATEPGDHVRGWSSTDGRTWHELEASSLPAQGTVYRSGPFGDALEAFHPNGSWHSEDGVTWQAYPSTPSFEEPVRLPGAWLMTGDGGFMVMPDGGDWMPVDLGELVAAGYGASDQGSTGIVVGTTDIWIGLDESGRRDVWYIDFGAMRDAQEGS